MCVRFPEDLDAALRARAEAEGLSPSELLRALAQQYVYNEQPSVDAGYMHARSLAIKLAHEAVSRAVDEHLPRTYEEAIQAVQLGTPYRKSRQGG